MPSYYYYISSSTSPLTIIILLILAFLSFTNGQDCSRHFSKSAKEMNMTKCKKLGTLGAEFAWNFTIIGNTKSASTTRLHVLFRANLKTPSGWVAWGVNPGNKAEMVGTKAIIAIKHSDGTMKVDTYNVTRKTKQLGFCLKPSPIEINVLYKSSWSSPNLYTYISATLLLPFDKYNITKLNHVWQVGEDAIDEDNQILRHRSTLRNVDSSETIDLTTFHPTTTRHTLNFDRGVHGVLSIIGWGTLLPSGVIIARYFRDYPFRWKSMWMRSHIIFQSSGFIIGTIAWAIGLNLGNASNYSFLQTHRTLGILIFTLSTIQILAFPLKPSHISDNRRYWNMFHHIVGYGLMTIIIMNIFRGINILGGGLGWKWTYIGILTILSFITLILEIITWTRFYFKDDKPVELSKGKNENPGK